MDEDTVVRLDQKICFLNADMTALEVMLRFDPFEVPMSNAR